MGVMDDYIAAHPAPEPPAAPPQRVYTLDDKTTALVYLARYHGRASMAHTALKEERGLDVPVTTLQAWKGGEEFEAVSRTFAQRLEDELIREARENAHAAAAVERQGLERIERMLEANNVRPSDVAAMVNAATATKVKNIDKVLAMTGRPQVITERRDFGNIVDALVQKGVLKLDVGPADVDSTAEEA